MTKNLEALKSLTTPPPPAGWTAGATWDGTEGYVTTRATSEAETPSDGQWDHVFEQFGLDPDKYTIEGPVRHSAWEVPGHDVQHAYRARIVERPDRTFDVDDLIATVRDVIPAPSFNSDKWRTVVCADTHIGKAAEDGAGSEMLAKRWMKSASKAIGSEAPHKGINLMLAGDTIEGYVSNKGAGIAQTDLTLTEQIRVASHLVKDTVELALSNAETVIVSVVGGNHSETTRQQHRPMTDNFDILIASNVEMAMKDTYGDRLKFYYPEPQRGSVTYQAGDAVFTLVHGHKFKGKMNGAEKWWGGHINNGRPPASATILVAGHFHGFEMKNWTKDRWIMFAPALEDESTWLAEIDGSTSQAGMLYFDTEGSTPCRIGVA